jgi:hypothetical protein
VTSKYYLQWINNKAIDMKGVDADYAYYKKSNLLWFCCQTIKKIEELPLYNCIQTTPMYANTYVKSGNRFGFLKTFDRLISEFKTDLILQNQFASRTFITTQIEMRHEKRTKTTSSRTKQF